MLALLDEFEAAGHSTRGSRRCASACSAPNRGPRRCATRSRSARGSTPSTPTGSSELIGPGVAQEFAETKDGLHVWEDHFHPEVVDPLDGHVVADGEHGELVFTSLTKEAMPIVRYRTRDLSRLLPGHGPAGVPADGEGDRVAPTT